MTTLTLKRELFHFEDIFKMQQAEGNKDLKLILQFPGGFTQEVLTTNKMFNLIKCNMPISLMISLSTLSPMQIRVMVDSYLNGDIEFCKEILASEIESRIATGKEYIDLDSLYARLNAVTHA